MCKKIHRGRNAEQYHADKKYKEAVAVAVEACADDTSGICDSREPSSAPAKRSHSTVDKFIHWDK